MTLGIYRWQFDEKNIAEKTAEEISNKYNVETLAITKDVSIEKDMQEFNRINNEKI